MTAIAFPIDIIDVTTSAAIEEKKKLRKHFARFDILFFLICTLVGLDTIGSVAAKGPEGFSWLAILALVFFVPYALLTSELGTAFPEEGGPYVWTRLAFGRKVAAVNALIYWVSNPIWVGGSLGILALTTFQTFFASGSSLPGPAVLGTATIGDIVFVLAFIWFTVIAAILSFNIGKWIPTIGAFVRIGVLGLFVLSVIFYAAKNGVQGFGVGDFGISYVGFIGLVPVLFFNYVGFELPNAAGEEMKDPKRDVPFAVFRSAIGTVLLYGGPILAILLVLPKDQVTGLTGFIASIQTVFTVYGGSVAADGTVTLTGLGSLIGGICAISFILALLSSGTTWVMGADRAQAMAALDGSAPRILGTFSARFGTPIAVNILSGTIATLVMLIAFFVSNGDASKYFAAVLGLAISTTTISYLAIFPALIKLRRSHPHVHRPYSVPGGQFGALIVTALTTFFALLATIGLLWPGFGTSNPDASLPPKFVRSDYELTQIVPLVILFAVGILFYVAGRGVRASMVQVSLEDDQPIGTT
ncbi:MAG TPA: APC family permease [Candidatus Acidoferrum sp.]|nr:APC family permease [Candidatus Acidoferrum sp.]